ncbi:MAG: aminoglycoside phosphotransferase family protein [Acidimicrobiales bacterium]
MTGRMHVDEIDTDADLVRRLLRSQHPRWAELPIERVASAGTDNAMYRLGEDLAVRLPRIHWAVDAVDKEQRWLPVLAPHLPLSVPRPVAAGVPGEGFPHPWGVVEWLPGEMAALDRLADPVAAALDLAAFVRALRAVDPTGGPRHRRGGPLHHVDAQVREALAGLETELDREAVLEVWAQAVAAPRHAGPPVWFHGDLGSLNLLAVGGRLTSVIDWGTCGVGDPAVEALVAWNLFPADARAAYREALAIDDDAWARGKGWVLTGIFGLDYYRTTNPVLVARARRGIEAVLADHRGGEAAPTR